MRRLTRIPGRILNRDRQDSFGRSNYVATGLGDLEEGKRERKNEWMRVDAKEKLMRFKLRNAKEASL